MGVALVCYHHLQVANYHLPRVAHQLVRQHMLLNHQAIHGENSNQLRVGEYLLNIELSNYIYTFRYNIAFRATTQFILKMRETLGAINI